MQRRAPSRVCGVRRRCCAGLVLAALTVVAGRAAAGTLPAAGCVNHMQPPPLSIAMPTRNRPGLLERALRSVVRAVAPVAEHIEVAVSDGSDDGATGEVVERVLTGWPAGYRYVWNRPALSLVENMNRAVEISTGQWVMQLHDDDYLLPGAGAAMLDAIRRAAPGESVLLFGVHIVDIDGVRRREQTFRRERYLEPREALRRLLRNSSFVREPTAVVRRAAMEQEGLFDTTVGGAADTDMWVRLFSRYGVRCLPQATCAYTIHEGGGDDRHVEPRHHQGERRDLRPSRRPGHRARAHHPALAGRLGTTSSSWRAPTAGCGWDGGPRPARCCGCSSCRRSATGACRRSGCPCGPRSWPPRRGRARRRADRTAAHSTRSSQISRQYG